MGPAYLSTIIYQYFALPAEHSNEIKLRDKNLIIDANSFIYYIYDQILREAEREKFDQERLTNSLFMKTTYWEKIKIFFKKLLKNSCRITVVFDGIYKSHQDKRPDPHRYSTERFTALNQVQNQLPILMNQQFISILEEFKIDVHVARGEADPVVASLARDNEACVLAWDSDYHLYDLPEGYIPLRHLDLESLTGPLYHMSDVFERLDPSEVGLFAAVVAYDYISFENLAKFFSNLQASDKVKFNTWLDVSQADQLKRQWLFTQWATLRFIQANPNGQAYQRLLAWIPTDKQNKFNRIISNYAKATPIDSINTCNKNKLHGHLDGLFIKGHLDRAIIDIVISRAVLIRGNIANPVYFRMLLSIVQILFKWDRPQTTDEVYNPTVEYKGETHQPLQMMEKDVQLPSLDAIRQMSTEDGQKWFFYCVQKGFQNSNSSSITIKIDHIRPKYRFWLCFVKLWYHTGNAPNDWKTPSLLAIILSYVMTTLLNQEKKVKKHSSNRSSVPLLQQCQRKLREYFTKDDRDSFQQNIESKCKYIDSNLEVKQILLEVEHLYRVLRMINQFFNLPLEMPTPNECVNEYCSPVATILLEKQNPEKFVQDVFFRKNDVLKDLLQEVLDFVYN